MTKETLEGQAEHVECGLVTSLSLKKSIKEVALRQKQRLPENLT